MLKCVPAPTKQPEPEFSTGHRSRDEQARGIENSTVNVALLFNMSTVDTAF